MRTHFFLIAGAMLASSLFLATLSPWFWFLVAVAAGVSLLGVRDCMQTAHAVQRNFPVIGHFRYLLEAIRPEINQYFIESNTDGRPFHREERSVVYQRAKQQVDTVPFGTQWDVYETGYEWIAHSINAIHLHGDPPRVLIGEGTCDQPYSSSLLNISAMSFGSLSQQAIRSLNGGAKQGGFAHNTGEGGISPYHLEPGGDLIWQIGTGYFGCRNEDGTFDPLAFERNAMRPNVKMIEIKLSQGAKPGHGGILPAAKVTEEIAKIRGVVMGQDVLSPPGHSSFSTPLQLLDWVTELRRLSGGKPVGIKLCIGRRTEFMALCRAMRLSGKHPDFIAVDGGEGGTGAAPVEFSNSVGMPRREGLVFVHNCLVGFDLRDKVKVIASGKILSGFDVASNLAMGADVCHSARAMMMALGCIQARRCNENVCPVGVATQHPGLAAGLDVPSKAERVASYHRETVQSFLDLLGAAGLDSPDELTPHMMMRRTGPTEVKSYFELYPFIERGALLFDPVPPDYERAWLRSDAVKF
jgi:glutamate synthase domain-containing protein 2